MSPGSSKNFSSTRAEHPFRPYALFVYALQHLHGRGRDKDSTEGVRILRLSVIRVVCKLLAIWECAT